MAQYHINQHLREPMQIKEFRPVEKEFRTQLSKAFTKQTNKVLTRNFIRKLTSEWSTLNLSLKKEYSYIDAEFDSFLDEQLNDVEALQEDSNESEAILAILLLFITRSIEIGIKLDKLKLVQQIQGIEDERIQSIIDGINFENIELTNTQVLDHINQYSAELLIALNEVQKARLKRYLYTAVKSGKDLNTIISESSNRFKQMNERRAWTVARTEIIVAKGFENRFFLHRRGLERWIWICGKPHDICLANCGSIRRIGDAFPSGHVAPTVHPNCQCITEAYVPDNEVELIAFVGLLTMGRDWSGE